MTQGEGERVEKTRVRAKQARPEEMPSALSTPSFTPSLLRQVLAKQHLCTRLRRKHWMVVNRTGWW